MYNDIEKSCSTQLMLAGETLLDNLSNQLKRAKSETARLEELIQILKDEPKMQRALELLGGRF